VDAEGAAPPVVGDGGGTGPAVPDAADPMVSGGRAESGAYVVERRMSPAHRAVPRIGGARPLAAVVIALGLGLAALVIASVGQGPGAAPSSAAAPSTGPSAQPLPSAAQTPAAPQGDLRAAELRLPTVDVRSRLVELDVGPDGALQPPADPAVAGWYVRGSVPGEPGPTVIAGHVDSRTGPAVFYRLGELAVGDRVEVTRSDGQVFAYSVVAVERHPKNDFPTAAVYGPTPGPALHLITCGGTFDRRIGHYRDNVVVTALPTT
jgi:hypothetical protein